MLLRARMKTSLGYVAWLFLVTQIYAQYSDLGFGIRRELFFLHLEDGLFGCQVNESVDVLQLFEISKLCDGVPNCFMGSDELRRDLKCTGDCPLTTGKRCQNGACLDHQCICNDGFGGKGCEIPDENECKYRPCDVFAQCKNTLGGFYCNCLPGYAGDGFNCTDINECEDPDIAGSCVENGECVNLPGFYMCKCKDGYEGDGDIKCVDIDECESLDACGSNAVCENFQGNYTCHCPEGFIGNPYDGCADIDECSNPDACGDFATCENESGSYKCTCPKGFTGDGFKECFDIDECAESPCGKGAVCHNKPGSFECKCPKGMEGNPKSLCVDVNECLQSVCGTNATCTNTEGSFSCACPEGYAGDPFRSCTDFNECENLPKPCGSNAICENHSPGYNCICPVGFEGLPNPNVACEQVDVGTLCKSNFDCISNAVCVEGQCFCSDGFEARGATCVDVDECALNPCGDFAQCRNIPGKFECECDQGYFGNPPFTKCKEPCEGVKCGEHAQCEFDGREAYCDCDAGWTMDPESKQCVDVDECEISKGIYGNCGANSACTNTPGSFKCQCLEGYTGDARFQCLDIDECSNKEVCGEGAICENVPGSYTCKCPDGLLPNPDPETECIVAGRCAIDEDCPGNSLCDPVNKCMCPEPNIGPDCKHPCELLSCSPQSKCMLINGEAKCLCHSGFTGSADSCVDINECEANPCGANAVCLNQPGKFTCECPGGFEGNPYKEGCKESATSPPGCNADNPCPTGEICIPDNVKGQGACVCAQGFTRDPTTQICIDLDECAKEDGATCGLNAVCINIPGSFDCQCPTGFSGNPFVECQACSVNGECKCQPPYQLIAGSCLLVNCHQNTTTDKPCPAGAECITIAGGVSYCACPVGFSTNSDGSCSDINECESLSYACAPGAICSNTVGSFSCSCPIGTVGEAINGACTQIQQSCSSDADCTANEKCVQPGECMCLPPYFSDTLDGNKCKSPCERFACGLNSQCTPTDPPKCLCETGHTGNPMIGCTDINECLDNPCGDGAECINEKGGYKCKCPEDSVAIGDAYNGGCEGQSRTSSKCLQDDECDGQLACIKGECVNPCTAIPCGPNAECEPEDHAAWCRCRSGYKEDASGSCVNVCDNFVCAPNAVCIVTSDGPTCSCSDGYNGNPFPGGECLLDVCSAGNPCQEPQVCVGGRCKERCEGITCGVGAKCDKNSNACVCLPYFIGNPEMLCVPPVLPPICVPSCGQNAHCEYGSPNKCVCNPGLSGNPYESCGTTEKSCVCGTNAECRHGGGRSDCACPVGFQGNPYIMCEDVNECLGDACGMNAVCINTIGSFDCRCREGTTGNPFMMCMPPVEALLCEGDGCPCDESTPCAIGMVCKDNRCKSPCDAVECGPNALCSEGICKCPNGLTGSPNDPTVGCKVPISPLTCQTDLDCPTSDVCLPGTAKGDARKCFPACESVQCGPNTFCVAENHEAVCLCNDGLFGDPNDVKAGCHDSISEDRCSHDNDCPGSAVCRSDLDGVHSCIDPCATIACGANEVCRVQDDTPLCDCQLGYVRNTATSTCQKPVVPDCYYDGDCDDDQKCVPDALGVRRCNLVCADYNCPQNSECITVKHRGSCKCKAGYSGNPNDRNGCRAAPAEQCRSDAECKEWEACREKDGVRRCVLACSLTKCGPGAVCVAKNHAGNCQCPSGKLTGNPNSDGCRQVECISNSDCPGSHSCDKLNFKCIDVCIGACGTNSVCIADKHMPMCTCPAGYEPNPHPEIACDKVDPCLSNPCHPTATCVAKESDYDCVCPPSYIGDPFQTGCRANGTCPGGSKDCPPDYVCRNGQCINPCIGFCGPNAICEMFNSEPVCTCDTGFTTGGGGCSREGVGCDSDGDCESGACVDGACKVSCQVKTDCAVGETCFSGLCSTPCRGSSQCATGQACIGGICAPGCRTDSDCPTKQSCINNKCEDPCQFNSCGKNAICAVSNHVVDCECPKGFVGFPTAQQGCVRAPSSCRGDNACGDGFICEGGKCISACKEKSECSEGEHCLKGMCLRACYNDASCSQGDICVSGMCKPGCRSNFDCGKNEDCHRRKCVCPNGYTMASDGNCVDVDECSTRPCHPSASCVNTLGSFKCLCVEGSGDPYGGSGCLSAVECDADSVCDPNSACMSSKCADPCSTKNCGTNAYCTVVDHEAICTCPSMSKGNPDVECYPVECEKDGDCLPNRACDTSISRCVNPCDVYPCRDGVCNVVNHLPTCVCRLGFQLVNNECKDSDECLNSPCHPSAECVNRPGSYQCVCPEGLVGDPYVTGCRDSFSCRNNGDCPSTAVCTKGSCKNPCSENICGKGAECMVENHSAVCKCPFETSGDPYNECYLLECVESMDCPISEACINYKCVNPCTSNLCGQHSTCVAQGHKAVCNCLEGFTGNPVAGCMPIVYCTGNEQCPGGMNCVNGLCSAPCQSARDCLPTDQCVDGECRPTCSATQPCPKYQTCNAGLCVPEEPICRADTDCDSRSVCVRNDVGIAECGNPCAGTLCGRNAECSVEDHQPVCRCLNGYFGNPQDDKVGCTAVECEVDSDCSLIRHCSNSKCVSPCREDNPCADNAICFNEKHKAVCRCKPGFTGDGKLSCTEVDNCASNPCAPGATCINGRGTYQCSCRDGYIGDAYNEGCYEPIECEADSDCPINALCGEENGRPKCQDLCTGVECGPNAECTVGNRVAACNCYSGYTGEPSDLEKGCYPANKSCRKSEDCPLGMYCDMDICKPPCKSDSDCPVSSLCSGSQCINPCDQPGSCGLNAVCDVIGFEKSCSCPEGFTGDARIECMRMPSVCRTNADCKGIVCKDGMCMPICKVDNDCALNEKCVDGDCMLTCRMDNDCFLGHICSSNKCIIGCRGNEDCASSQACIGSKCLSPCKEDSCGPSALCTVISHRPQCNCPDGFIPNPTAYLGCAREPIMCTTASDCGSGFMCMEKTCKPICASDNDCLSSERCAENGVCRPICRFDDDCRSGEICGDSSLCILGCRSDDECPSERACINAKCKDKCKFSPCGANALCNMELHRPICTCPNGLEGDPEIACHHPLTTCKQSSDCLTDDFSCIDGLCRSVCTSDQQCLTDEKCRNGACHAVCNSDESCTEGEICSERICVAGCRTESACPSNLACINGKCDDPCAEGVSNCGSCAICEVSNHIAQCTCPAETVGDPLIGCTTVPTRCSANRECGLGGICDGGYCSKACTRNSDCGCKWNCLNKKCKQQCSIDSECPTNQFCQNYVCTAGCRSNRDCPTDKACVNRNCTDPCSADPSPCGKGAECRVSRRRPVCLCPTGTQGDPGKECKKYECTSNRDCDLNKRCSAEKKCVNPCEEKGACGLNAECKVAFRKAQCACPPGYFGNPFVDCKPDVDECQKNPCGANAKCTDTVGSYVCTCLPGCRGDPFSGCICPSAQVDPCKAAKCGVNAECRIEGNKGVCFCPDNYSVGDPSKECSNERSGGDCTVSGCGMNAKCVKEGDTHICKCNPGLYGDPEVKCMPDRICTSDFQCPADKACTKGKCVDPCSLRDVCGENALCRVVLHKSRCSCPQCFIGDPREKCIPDPRCSQTPVKPPVIAPPKTDDGCVYDKNCPRHLMCDKTTRQCVDPCIHTALECEPSKRCAVRNHKPICMCKNGYVLSDVGVLICGPDKIECRKDDDCGSNLACINFKCQNPCAVRNPCSANKQCEVLEHKPVCICVEDCKPSVSICLRDRGCPENLACIGYQCRNPCDKHKCPDDTPCYVEDHKPTCKFCPDGFKADQKFGCIKAIGCETNDDCGGRQACINSQCASPCELNTCKTGEACTVKDHEPVCGPVCACKESSDCPIRHSCDGCNCKAITFQPDRADDCEEPCADGEPNCYDGCFTGTQEPVESYPSERPSIVTEPVLAEVSGASGTLSPLVEGGKFPAFPNVQETPPTIGVPGTLQPIELNSPIRPSLSTEAIEIVSDAVNQQFRPVTKPGAIQPVSSPMGASTIDGLPGTLPTTLSVSSLRPELPTEPIDVEADEKLGSIQPSSAPQLPAGVTPPQIDTGVTGIPGTFPPLRPLGTSIRPQIPTEPVVAEAESIDNVIQPVTENAILTPFPPAGQAPGVTGIPGTAQPIFPATTFRPLVSTDAVNAEIEAVNKPLEPLVKPETPDTLPAPQEGSFVTGLPGTLEPIITVSTLGPSLQTEPVISEAQPVNTPLEPVGQQGQVAPTVPPQQAPSITGIPGTLEPISLATTSAPQLPTEPVISEADQSGASLKPIPEQGQANPPSLPQEAPSVSSIPGTLPPISSVTSTIPQLQTEPIISEVDEPDPLSNPIPEQGQVNPPPPQQAPPVSSIPGTLPPLSPVTPTVPQLVTEPIISQVDEPESLSNPVSEQGQVSPPPPPEQAPPVSSIPGTLPPVSPVTPTVPQLQTEPIISEVDQPDPLSNPIPEQGQANPPFPPPQQAPPVSSIPGTLPPLSPVTPTVPPLQTEPIISEVDEPESLSNPVSEQGQVTPPPPPQEAPPVSSIPGTLPPVSSMTPTAPQLQTEPIISEVDEQEPLSNPIPEQGQVSPPPPPEQAPPVSSIPGTLPPLSPVTPTAPQLQTEPIVSEVEEPEPLSNPVAEQGQVNPPPSPQQAPPVSGIPGTTEPIFQVTTFTPLVSTEAIAAETGGINEPPEPLAKPNEPGALPSPQEGSFVTGLPGTLVPIATAPTESPSLQTEPVISEAEQANVPLEPVAEQGQVSPVAPPQQAPSVTGIPGVLSSILPVTLAPTQLQTQPIVPETGGVNEPPEPLAKPNEPASLPSPQEGSFATGLPGTLNPIVTAPTTGPSLLTEPVVAEAEQANIPLEPVAEQGQASPVAPPQQSPSITGIPGAFSSISPVTFTPPQLQTEPIVSEAGGINEPLEPLGKPNDLPVLTSPQADSFVTGLPGTLKPIATAPTVGPSLETEPVISEAEPANVPLEPLAEQGQAPPLAPPQQVPSVTGIPGTLSPISPVTLTPPHLQTEPVASEVDEAEALSNPIPEQGQVSPFPPPQQAPSVTGIPGTLPPVSFVTPSVPQLQTEPIISEADVSEVLSNPVPEQGQANLTPPPQEAPPVTGIPGTLSPASFATPTIPQLQTEPVISEVGESGASLAPMPEQGQLNPLPPPQEVPSVSGIPGTLQPSLVITTTRPLLQTEPIVSEADENSGPLEAVAEQEPLSPLSPPQQAPTASGIPGTLPPLNLATSVRPELQTEAIISELGDSEPSLGPISQSEVLKPAPSPQPAPVAQGIPGTPIPSSLSTTLRPAFQTESVLSESSESNLPIQPIAEQEPVGPQPPLQQAPAVTSVPGTFPPLPTTVSFNPVLPTEEIITELENERSPLEPIGKPQSFTPLPPPQQAPAINGIPDTMPSLSPVLTTRPTFATEPILAEAEQVSVSPSLSVDKGVTPFLNPPQAKPTVLGIPGTLPPQNPSLSEKQEIVTEKIQSEAELPNESLEPVVKPINLGTNNGLPVVAQSTPSSGLPLSSPSPLFPTQSVEVEPNIKQSTVKPIVDPVRPFTTVAPMGIVPQGTVSQPAFTVRPQDISTESVIAESSDSELPFVSPQVKPGGFNTNPPTAVDQETVLSTRPGFSNTPTAATENVESAFETSSPNLKPMTVSPTVIQTNPFPILAESVTVNEVPTSKEPPFISQENIEVETEPPKARPLPIAETQKPPVGSFPLGILQGSTTLSSTKSPLQLSPATEPIESEIESEQGPPFPVDKPGSFSTQEPAIVVTETSTIFPVATSLSPSRDEQQVLIACSSDSDCPLRESCINQACLNPCNFNVCGSNTECFVLNHKATCTCLAGFTGSPTSGCKPIPVIAENTPTVIGTACDPSPCGKNAECKEGPDSLAICVCNEGYEDRGEGCRPECETNSDCPSQLACINARCADPCPGSCGPNSDCKVANHNPMCACKPGFTGDAFEGCNIIPAIAASTTPRELSPCLPSPCGTNAICKSQGTAASCICPEDYTGDPFESCRPECVLSSDCPSDKICENRHCINPCPAACGNSAECRVIGHSVTCSCQPGFTGDPLVDCKAIPVSVEPIVEEKSDVCEPSPCGIRADCKSSEGAAACFCPTGLTGDPMDECRPECVTNSDCPQTNACRNQKCVDPCSIATCGRNSVCQVVRHNPVCTCPPGFVGDPFTQCVVVAEEAPQVLEQPECIVDDECPPSKSCVRQICVDPCAEEPCAENAICTVQNHRAQCRCAFGFVGDPRNGCTRVDGVIGCTNDDCPSNEACINGVCQNPCDCGPNSDCKVVDHRPICLCKDGYAGDPNVGCYQVGCRADDECPSDTACHNGRCINPCVIDDPCAISAQCYPANHQANCRCPPGTEGDPRVRCTAVGCRVHGDCPQDKACVEKNCVDPCLSDNPCAPSAECFTEKHSAGCRCPDDRPSGDPAIGCEAISKIDEFPVVTEPECRADDDCPSQFACMDGRCKQLCLETKPCHETALCVVIDSSPFKSMACRCKDGMVPDESGVCTPVQIPYNVGCTVDSDCPDTEACINNQCRSPCSCGRNAVCLVQNHHPICLCQEGFAGNPQTGCYAVGCRGNGDCDFDKACHNGNCVNPCLVSDPCAPTAECFGMNHEAECRCPLGMEGNPREGCFVVGCRSDQDCPEEAACRNGKCVNPCLYDECGPRAECFPAVHRANCRCPPGFTGNAKISCDRIPVPECTVDSDCPFKEACVNTLCVEPCATLDPCHNTAVCRAVNTVPMRTLICACPDGFIAAEEGSCRALVPVVDGCTYDEECPSDKACINSQCKDPCNCGPHTVCRVEEHQPICQCAPGYDGDPLIGCYLVGCTSSSDCPETHACQNEICTPVCGPNNEPCGPSSECEGMDHKPFCVCPPGTSGNPYSTTGCTAIGCESNNDCPSDRACINGLCVSPCTQDVCLEPAMCKADNHTVNCICPVGYEGDEKDGCTRVQIDCKFDEACPSKEACINGVCVLPCAVLEPCADDVECKVADTTPVKTLLCECPPGFIFYNNTCVLATQPAPCDIEKGFIITKDGECICPLVKGFVVDEKGKCTCPLEKGFEIDEEGNCGCPPDFFRTDNGTCELIPRIDKECDTNEDCPSEKACETGICVDPCSYEPCGINAICTPIAHEATCSCPTGYIGNPKTGCTVTGRTDIPRPDMAVNCLADGVQLDIFTNDPGFDGVIYVKGHSKEEMCRKVVSSQRDIGPFDFKVKFGTCDLVLIDGTASFILVVQKHPQLLTVKAQAYQIRCVYETSTKEIELGFNVSMISTAGTIANTGPPPVCAMRICTTSGREISQAEIGDSLMLKIDVTPNSIYGGFARSCYAITSNADGDDTKYEVTDENGCPKDPAVFGNWDYDPENGTLAASFNAFKFPSSDSISFQCNVRVCFGRCQPVNCGGYEAYGRRKRDVNITREARAKLRDAEQKGLLREEITVQSNYIFTVERREERFSAPTEAPDTARIEEVCVNKLGFIIALIITALLALVAVAIAVSCWLMAYRRRPKIHGPLPHPPEFPNPLFTTPEPLAEPSPDYMS